MNTYKMRKSSTKPNGNPNLANYVLGVPREIGERLHGRRFEFTVTDDGILYRPVDDDKGVELPAWADES